MTKYLLLATILLTGCCQLAKFPTPYSTLTLNEPTTQHILIESNTLSEKHQEHKERRPIYIITFKLLEF